MTARPDTWMPLYVGDYLRDTTRLTTVQHGAYLLLIMDYWVNGPPPDDNEQLASIVGCSISEWQRSLRPALLRFFHIVDGVWRQKRIDAELEEARKRVSAKSEAGKKGADVRWGSRIARPRFRQ